MMINIEKNVRPPFVDADVVAFVQQYYGITATAHELPSELDRNFRLISDENQQYVLKINNSSISTSVLDLQNQVMAHVAEHLALCQQVVPTIDGRLMPVIAAADGQAYTARLLTFLPGTPLVDFRPHSEALLHDLGAKQGELDRVLQTFDHPEKRQTYRWNVTNVLVLVDELIDHIEIAERRDLVRHFAEQFREVVLPVLPDLRSSFIHNDANDTNIIVQQDGFDEPFVSGLIDFGDMVYAPTVMELAVALTYVMMDKHDPLSTALPVVRGYHEKFALTEQEISVLYALIGARLCISVCLSAYQQRLEPENTHLSISERPAWDLLEELAAIPPQLAHYSFRSALGLVPCPQTPPIVDWLRASREHIFPLLGRELVAEDVVVFDLSASSTELGTLDEVRDSSVLTQRLFARLTDGKVGIGRYDEARLIYDDEMFQVADRRYSERRTVHLGMDVAQPPGTSIYAPLAGVVHSLQDSVGYQDYGPAIILEHSIPERDVRFYTLYGHLSRESLDALSVGMPVAKGAKIGEVGDSAVNGGWFPHVHVQIIADMLGREGEFPGVAAHSQRDVWLSLSPDANLLLNVPEECFPAFPLDRETILSVRREHIAPVFSISYRRPLKIVRGYMQNLYDEHGRAYLDCVNNVPTVGHEHPRVVRAAQKQMATLNTNTRYLHDNLVEYAERLVATLPDPLSVCFFVNSGSEANDLALRMARAHTGGDDVVVIDHAYHGHTSALIDISPYKFNGRGGEGRREHVHVAVMPDGYRGAYRGYDEHVGRRYAEDIGRLIQKLQQEGRKVSAFFAESVLGCGGQVVLPEGYLQAAFDYIRSAGGVCVVDEVQIGFGRVGAQFWGFGTQAVIPDIVTMGKPIANGHPMGAVVTTPEIAASFNNGMEYFNTFGGNPVSCAIALETLNVIQDDGLQQNAHDVGEYLRTGFRSLADDYPIIGDVRGLGLFMGVELVQDADTLDAAPVHTSYLVESLRQRGLLLSTEGPLHNVLKIKPPLVFSRRDADFLVEQVAQVLSHNVMRI